MVQEQQTGGKPNPSTINPLLSNGNQMNTNIGNYQNNSTSWR